MRSDLIHFLTEFEIGVPNVSAVIDDKLFLGVSWTFLNTRTGKGGADSALPSCFLWISFEVFVWSPWFFQYLPQNKRRTFWCKNWRRVDFWGSIFKPPKSALPFFAELMPWRGCPGAPPPAPAGWARPVARGAAGRWGGGGAGRALGGAGRVLGGRRRPVKVTDSRERRPGEPSSGAAGQWRRMKGQGQYTYMCDTSPWKLKCECASTIILTMC